MPDELRLIAAFAVAVGAAYLATPRAIALAVRTDFNDKPAGYKGHARPTPYLGGLAVLAGFLVAAVAFAGEVGRLWPLVALTVALWGLGTLDDRIGLSPSLRLAIEAVAAIALWSAGLGWDVFGSDAADLGLTVFWVLALVNAFNLMDNMDGAAATVAGVTALAIGAAAIAQGDVALAVLLLALAGACAGFLPYNLTSPARIFLGDGGSLTVGFVLAAGLMALSGAEDLGPSLVLAAALLAGVPVVDTALVMVSRRRAGVPLLTGGRDHMTHRLLRRLGRPRDVALILGVIQAGAGTVAVGVIQLGRGSIIAAWCLWFAAAFVAITVLESAAWAPIREPVLAAVAPDASPRVRRLVRATPAAVEVVVITFVTVSFGLSPFFYGFYDSTVWAPIGLGLLASLMGMLIAHRVALRRHALVALVGLIGLCLWTLLSAMWAESAAQAITEANRWLVYAALFALMVRLLSSDRLGRVVVAAGTTAIVVLASYVLARIAVGQGPGLFLAGRLSEPLGYANGEAAYLLLGFWPLAAVAERARPAIAGGALALATMLLSVALLTQSRAALPAVAVSAIVLLAAVPGRKRRAWALAFVLGGVAVGIGPVLGVSDDLVGSAMPDAVALQKAALAILAGAVLAGAAWAAGNALLGRRSEPLLPRVPARPWVLTGAPLLAIAVAAAIAVIQVTGDPVRKVETEYAAFVELRPEPQGQSRLTVGSGNRYDYWRIAAMQFSDQPLRGVGAGNYDGSYYQERRSSEDVRQPHSLIMQTLGELGLVGAALLLLFIGAVLSAFMRRARAARGDPTQIGVAVACGGAVVLWLVHASVDWVHLIPGVTGIALCFAAVLVGPRARPKPHGSSRPAIAGAVAGVVACVLGAGLLGRGTLADYYREQGREALPSDPRRALTKAAAAVDLDGESVDGYYLSSAAYARLGEYGAARTSLLEAARREPHDFVTWALLGDLAVRRGDSGEARRSYRRAVQLNPRDRSLSRLLEGES